MADLTDNIGPKKVIEKTNNGSTIVEVSRSGHIIFMNNPSELVAKIIKHKRIFDMNPIIHLTPINNIG